MYETIIVSALGGLCWSLGGYFNKWVADKKIKFEPIKAVKPIVVGLLVGAYAGYTGMVGQFDIVSTSAVIVPITAVADRVVSIIYKILNKNK